MPKEKSDRKVVKLRHEPLNRQIEKKNGKLKVPKSGKISKESDDVEEYEDDDVAEKQYSIKNKGNKGNSYDEEEGEDSEWQDKNIEQNDDDPDEDIEDDDVEDEEVDGGDEEDIVELDGENFAANGLSESEV